MNTRFHGMVNDLEREVIAEEARTREELRPIQDLQNLNIGTLTGMSSMTSGGFGRVTLAVNGREAGDLTAGPESRVTHIKVADVTDSVPYYMDKPPGRLLYFFASDGEPDG